MRAKNYCILGMQRRKLVGRTKWVEQVTALA